LVCASATSQTDTTSETLTIHYHRYDGTYQDPTMWTWDATGKKEPVVPELEPSGRDEFGIVFTLDLAQYGDSSTEQVVGFLLRFGRDWNRKEGTDRTWKPSMGREIYLVSGTSEIFTSKPDVSPSIQGAYYDDNERVTVRLSHAPKPADLAPAKAKLMDETGRSYAIAEVTSQPDNLVILRLLESLPFEEHTITVRFADFKEAVVSPRRVLRDPHRFYDADVELGATYTKDRTTFRVFSPGARKASVVLYDDATTDSGRTEVTMSREQAGIWSADFSGDLKGKYYTYMFEGHRLDPKKEALDPYARCTSAKDGRALIVDLRETDPPGFRPIKRPPMSSPTDAIVYEIHVRDFSIAPTSGIKDKGHFGGFVEPGTRVPGTDVKTGIDHLEELGVTHVQLLPIQDFDNDEFNTEQYNWGYMPSHFNSPDGWYATNVRGPERVKEFKQLVQALHARGIRVIMDVVYNHTDNSAPFNRLVPDYYYRMTPNGQFHNGSGTGNEFDSQSPMGRKFIVDSCRYWVEEYGVDGFRFDLMGLVDLQTMIELKKAIQEVDPTIIVYGEPWAAGGSGLAEITTKDRIRGTGIGAFNDHFRDAVKGSTRGPGPGFVQAGHEVDRLRAGLLGSLNDWALEPHEALNYVDAHDDNVLWDKLLVSTGNASTAERVKMNNMALALVLTAQGRAFLHGGSEFLRTKDGVENSYNAPDAINQVDWDLKQANMASFNYVKGLIAIRRGHPVFRMASRSEVLKRARAEQVDGQAVICYTLDGRGLTGETWNLVRVYYNATPNAKTVTLPAGAWNVVVKGGNAGTETIDLATGTVSIEARTTLLIWQ